MKIGDKVTILRKDIAALSHRKKPWTGTVTRIDGWYVFVRPAWCRWSAELLRNEVKGKQ